MFATVLVLGDAPESRPDVGGRDVSRGRFESWGPDARQWFDDELARARVGWRCVVIGPRSDVARAVAHARGSGAIRDEITEIVRESPTREVYCAPCGTVTTTGGETVRCSSCATTLEVGVHWSPRLAAYLGEPCA